ncbi:hypothetical protein [Shimia biformata]|uniref:hypothetical protein n=1 Tax=Shimia biformata TaxID=1294299 RepID=UPI00194F1C5E|nr:hypothetical protein [Shimia biformata]
MKTRVISLAIATALVLPLAAHADNGKNHKGNKGNKAPVTALAGCPPGLAKKAVPCVPPGQVKKIFRPGDRILKDFIKLTDPKRYRLDPALTYLIASDHVYSVDPKTNAVLRLIGATADILR